MTNEELVERYQSGESEVLGVLIQKNDGLVKIIAKRYNIDRIASIDIDDLLQEGRLGLIIAASKYSFDAAIQTAFCTYAGYWIKQRISRFVYKKNTVSEISINKPVESVEGLEFAETLSDKEDYFSPIEDSIYYLEIHKDMDEVMANILTEQQRLVLELRFGWNGSVMTLSAIAQQLNVTIERVRQIEKRALRLIQTSRWARDRRLERGVEKYSVVTRPEAAINCLDLISKNELPEQIIANLGLDIPKDLLEHLYN